MIDVKINREDQTVHLKVDTVLTISAVKALIERLDSALKMLGKV